MKGAEKRIKRIRIGNQTAFSTKNPMHPFEYAVQNGFDAFEWFPDKKVTGAGYRTNSLNAKTRCYIRDMAHQHDILLSVHAPWWANPLESKNRVLLMKSLHFAEDLDAKLINMHLYPEKGIEAYVGAIINMIQHTVEMGIKFSIENTPHTTPEDFNKLFHILSNLHGLKTDHMGMCLDLGHANLSHSTPNDYLGFMDRLDPGIPIIHIHMHENYGDRDSHLTIFTGPSENDDSGLRDVIRRLKASAFSGAIIMEQWPDPPELLNQARDKLTRLFEII